MALQLPMQTLCHSSLLAAWEWAPYRVLTMRLKRSHKACHCAAYYLRLNLICLRESCILWWESINFRVAVFLGAVRPQPPKCEDEHGQRLRPSFVIQGAFRTDAHAVNGIYAGGKIVEYINWLLVAIPHVNITLDVLTRSPLPSIWETNSEGRVRYHHSYGMVDYHKAMQGSAFIMPLLSPDREETVDYFTGHPSSSLAYARALQLRVVGRTELLFEYDQDLDGIGFYGHGKDTPESFLGAVKVNDIQASGRACHLRLIIERVSCCLPMVGADCGGRLSQLVRCRQSKWWCAYHAVA